MGFFTNTATAAPVRLSSVRLIPATFFCKIDDDHSQRLLDCIHGGDLNGAMAASSSIICGKNLSSADFINTFIISRYYLNNFITQWRMTSGNFLNGFLLKYIDNYSLIEIKITKKAAFNTIETLINSLAEKKQLRTLLDDLVYVQALIAQAPNEEKLHLADKQYQEICSLYPGLDFPALNFADTTRENNLMPMATGTKLSLRFR